MRERVVLGSAVHAFGKFEDTTAARMCRRVALDALADAGLTFRDVQAVVVGSSRFSGGLARGLGATDMVHALGMTGVAAYNVAAACATGGSAFSLADLLVGSGQYDAVLAVAGEKMPTGFIARPDGAAEDATDVDYLRWAGAALPNPGYWAMECTRRMHDYGTTEETLARVSAKAHDLGPHNPNARYRKPIPLDAVMASPMVSSPLRLFELCAVSDGAAAVVVTSSKLARQHTTNPVHVAGTAVATAAFGDPVLTMPEVAIPLQGDSPPSSEATGAVLTAMERAGVPHEDVDLIELTDNSVWQELAFPEAWGFCEPGESDHLVQTDQTRPDGRLPINPSGGFLCFGEATVAMGLFQVAEMHDQLLGRAGARQVPNARVALGQTLGLGGNGSAVVLAR